MTHEIRRLLECLARYGIRTSSRDPVRLRRMLADAIDVAAAAPQAPVGGVMPWVDDVMAYGHGGTSRRGVEE